MAAGVLYICLWVLHGVVLVLPINGRELEFAHFKRGVNERRVHTMRENLGRVLRDLLERIHSVEGEPRELLIRETQPIVHLVNKAAGRDAMDTPPPPATEPSTASASPSSMHPSFTRTGVPAAQEPEDAFEAIFGKQSA